MISAKALIGAAPTLWRVSGAGQIGRIAGHVHCLSSLFHRHRDLCGHLAFFTEVRFDWSPGMIGISLTIYGVCFAVVQGALVKPFIARFGERRTLIYGLVIEVISLWLISIMTNGIILLMMIPFAALGVIANPHCRPGCHVPQGTEIKVPCRVLLAV